MAKAPHRPDAGDTWYADGLRFRCVPDCGACCTRHHDYAYVYLERRDVRELARFLRMTQREFLNQHTILDDGDVVLKMVENDCPFLDGSRCSVYRARPIQCRTFPFWRENLRSPGDWERLGGFCPGIDQGERRSFEEIRGHVDERERG